MSKLAPLDLFIRQALLYPLIAPFLPAVAEVEEGVKYAAGRLTGTLEVGEVTPTGTIVMWKGTIATIPAGWVLCNGDNDTPDLRDKFIVGAQQDDGGVAKSNVKGSLLQTGGAHEHTLTENEMPSHVHSYNQGYTQEPKVADGVSGAPYRSSSSVNTGSKGGDAAHENCPPFFALAFIMKT